MTNPGVQNPHWKPWLSRSASCSGFISPSRGESLDRRDRCAPRLDREHEARPDRLAVDQHGARPAHAVLAPEVRASEAEVLAEEVGQRLARLGGALAGAVYGEADRDRVGHVVPLARSDASVSARRTSTPATWRR